MTKPDAKLDPVVENRRAQLRRWIAHFFDGNQAAFGASTAHADRGERQINQGELSGLLKVKSFGEKRARSLEVQAQMPLGYLDSTSDPDAAKLSPFLQMRTPGARAEDHAFGPPIVWPFKLVTYRRLQDLHALVGPRAAAEAINDLDKQMLIVLMKWESEAKPAKKRAAGR